MFVRFAQNVILKNCLTSWTLGNAQERQARASADYEGSVLSALDYCLP